METGTLERLVGPSPTINGVSSPGEMPGQGEENIATLLRMFRYERPTGSREQDVTPPPSKVVAAPHKDLGLLSLVIGHTPGLECWDPATQSWVSCEEEGQGDSDTPSDRPDPPLKATLMVGQTLAKFTNWRYQAGPHRVFVHASSGQPSAELGPTDDTSNTSLAKQLLSSPLHRF